MFIRLLWVAVRSYYCTVGLLPGQITVFWVSVDRATVCRGCFLWEVSAGLLSSRAIVRIPFVPFATYLLSSSDIFIIVFLSAFVTFELLYVFKVSEYTFKEKRNTLKNIQVLLYTHFYNISLNVLRPNFFNICNLPISNFSNIKKIRVKVRPKTTFPTL